MRVFFAIPWSEEERGRIASLQEALATMPALDDFRWARAENVHLTLRFLGETPNERVDAAAGALRRACAGVCAFGVSMDRFGVFPNLKHPGVVWLGPAETPPPLADLEARLAHHLGEAGFPAHERPFRPHVTLARRRSRAGSPAGLEGELATAERRWLTPPLVCRAREAVLFRSELNPSGAIHTTVEKVALG